MLVVMTAATTVTATMVKDLLNAIYERREAILEIIVADIYYGMVLETNRCPRRKEQHHNWIYLVEVTATFEGGLGISIIILYYSVFGGTTTRGTPARELCHNP